MLTSRMRDEQIRGESIRFGCIDANGANSHRETRPALLPPLLDALVQPGNGTGRRPQRASARCAQLAQHCLWLTRARVTHGQQAAIGALQHGGNHLAQRSCTDIRLQIKSRRECDRD